MRTNRATAPDPLRQRIDRLRLGRRGGGQAALEGRAEYRAAPAPPSHSRDAVARTTVESATPGIATPAGEAADGPGEDGRPPGPGRAHGRSRFWTRSGAGAAEASTHHRPAIHTTLAVGLVMVLMLAAAILILRRVHSPNRVLAPGEGIVVDVVDGDTVDVRLAGGEERVRLLGIDTPETVDPRRPPECFGAEASSRTRELLPPGTAVLLERDVEPRDHFGRLLAYVYRRTDRMLVNRQLVAEGLATALSIAPNTSRQAELASVAAEARSQGRGLWSACARGPPG